jgi:hypothetical protein
MSATAAPSLTAGQNVIVRNVHVGMLPAKVERSAAGIVTVALAVKDERVPRLIGHEMAVELISLRGIHRYAGVLSAEDKGTLIIALSGDVERIQRREFVRVAAHLDVSVRGIDEELGGDTKTLDVSGSGIRISDPFELPLGLDVRVELQLPDGGPLSTLGRVVRPGADAKQKAIRFDALGRTDEERLVRYIRERELKALRASRD